MLRDGVRPDQAAWRRMSALGRYLLAARAALLALTVYASLYGGLLALPWTPAEGLRLMLAGTALVLAHATGHLFHDLLRHLWPGTDQSVAAPAARYGAYPLAEGRFGTGRQCALLALTAAATLLLGSRLWSAGGTPVVWLGGIGVLLMIGYETLRRAGLGELVVFLAWGPFMVGGVYWLVSADWGPDIAALSMLFGLGPAIAVLARHVDRRRHDTAAGVRTIASLLGARRAPWLVAGLAVGQLAWGIAWAADAGAWGYLLLLLTLPALARLLRTCTQAPPARRPAGFPPDLWPAWYGLPAYRFARTMAAALCGGAALDYLM